MSATDTAGPKHPQPEGGRAWPIGIVVGLGFVVIANAIMIGVALSHPSAPASQDHWAESLDWDRELEQRERSAALGWTIEALDRDGDGGLALRLRDAEGRPLSGLAGELRLSRADSLQHDARLPLISLGEGRYRSEPVAAAGLMQIEIDVHDDAGHRFVARRTLTLSASNSTAPAPAPAPAPVEAP